MARWLARAAVQAHGVRSVWAHRSTQLDKLFVCYDMLDEQNQVHLEADFDEYNWHQLDKLSGHGARGGPVPILCIRTPVFFVIHCCGCDTSTVRD